VGSQQQFQSAMPHGAPTESRNRGIHWESLIFPNGSFGGENRRSQGITIFLPVGSIDPPGITGFVFCGGCYVSDHIYYCSAYYQHVGVGV
jgi:hypothetical protein